MVYADSVEVNNLMGNKTIKNAAGSDITATVVTDSITRGDSRVKLETGYTGWSSTDDVWGSVQEASEYFAGAFILERYFDDKEKALMFYQKALDICNSLKRGTAQSIITVAANYRSYPLNSNASIYRSIPSGAGSTGDLDDSTLSGS